MANHDSSQNGEAWKAFQTDTKAGRLLQKLYGSQKKVEINYPGLVIEEGSTANRPAFIPGGGKVDADARTNRIKKVEVYSDYQGKPRKMPAPVQYLQRRKNQGAIERELQQRQIELEGNAMEYDATVPSTQVRKAKLQNDFQFKGGKALPAAGMMEPLGHTPDLVNPSRRIPKSEEEKLFDQVTKEIDDRQKFLRDMAAVGDHSHDERVTKEIQERIQDMEQLEKMIQEQKRRGK